MAAQGVPPRVAMNTYTHVAREMHREAVKLMGASLCRKAERVAVRFAVTWRKVNIRKSQQRIHYANVPL